MNLSVALVNNDHPVLYLHSVPILLTKPPQQLTMLYCLKGLLSLKVFSSYILLDNTLSQNTVQCSLVNHTTGRSPTSHSSDTLSRAQSSNPKEHKERPQLYVLQAYIIVYVSWSKGA